MASGIDLYSETRSVTSANQFFNRTSVTSTLRGSVYIYFLYLAERPPKHRYCQELH